jgi:putative PEP-CTERM system histidine kinase
MPISAFLSFAAAYFSLIIAATVLLRDKRSWVHRFFAAGLALFAAEELVRGMAYRAMAAEDVLYWYKLVAAASAISPGVWLALSLTYGRVNPYGLLSRWKWALLAATIAPLPFTGIFGGSPFSGEAYLGEGGRWLIPLGWQGQALNLFAIASSVLVLFNLERIIRSSVGRIRWQIKFVVLGVGGMFALHIYLSSQTLLYSTLDTGLEIISPIALIAANALFAVSLFRGRSLNVDVYLSTATIQNSLTILLAGIYLLSVGLITSLARSFRLNGSVPLDAFIVFFSLTFLAVLLLSNRLRRNLRVFVSRHFHRPIYDYRSVWMKLTQRTTSIVDANLLSTAASRMVSESLEILSVSVWLIDESRQRLTLAGSTALSGPDARGIEIAGKSASEFIQFMQDQPGCLDLTKASFSWPKEVMERCKEFFAESSMRYAIGLHAAGELVGVMTLNDDRVGRDNHLSVEDLALLETLAAQLAASLLNLKLSARLRQARELETFQMVSTFFVHDLKNVASRLSLTMQNLPANFDNPEFRKDALRVISASLTKIDSMCNRLALLREKIDLRLEQCDLNNLIASTLNELKHNLNAELEEELEPVPQALIDAEQIHTVLTNLVLNANEAVNGNGVIRVSTINGPNTVGFAVRDNGCGMSEEFIQNLLFRPFQTTKKKGLGIGLFHSKLIVEAHQGTVEVSSAVGVGTEFRVMLPKTPRLN